MSVSTALVRRVTDGPLYHWFGYYDMPCWDATQRYLLSLGVSFQERPPTSEDRAVIGMSDLATGEYVELGETRAFNWQQGAMMHWLPGDPGRRIIYNDRVGERFVSVVQDVFSGDREVLGIATSDVGLQGRLALGLNFARIAQTRPGYGYAGLADPWEDVLCPDDDGVYAMDLATGRSWLAVSMRQVLSHLGDPPDMQDAKMWFNHTLLNPSETRFVFLVRWRARQQASWRTLMFAATPDGQDLRLVLGDGMVSHFDWRNDRQVLAWTRVGDEGDHFYLIDVETGERETVGARFMTEDGHCSYSHNGRWILTDTYPDPGDDKRTLKVYIPAEDREVVLARLLSPPPFVGEIRCDLHPRWSRDDRLICFDSVHEGQRQVYVMETPPLDS